MTHPLKKFSVIEIQAAISDALQTLTGRGCYVHVAHIDFHEQKNEQGVPLASTSLRIEFDPDYGVDGPV